MSIKELQNDAVIKNEPGIIRKMGKGFHMPEPFAVQNLFYMIWGDEYLCDTTYYVNRKFLDSLSLFHIVHGEMEFKYRGNQFTALAGDTVFLDFRYPHYYKAVQRTRVRQYLIAGNAAQSYFELLYEQHGSLFRDRGKTSVLFNFLQNELNEPFPDDHKISFLIHQILSILIIQERPSVSAPVQKAQEYILQHFQEPLTVDGIAASVSLSRYYFSRLFKKETGFAPHEYLLDVRLRNSKQLLTETSLSVEQIAFQCGFTSAVHFIRAFKKDTLVTPSAFRKYFDPIGFR